MPWSQQCQIWASSATYTTAHGNVGSLPHWARPEIEPESSWIRVGFVSAVPQWELLLKVFIIVSFLKAAPQDTCESWGSGSWWVSCQRGRENGKNMYTCRSNWTGSMKAHNDNVGKLDLRYLISSPASASTLWPSVRHCALHLGPRDAAENHLDFRMRPVELQMWWKDLKTKKCERKLMSLVYQREGWDASGFLHRHKPSRALWSPGAWTSLSFHTSGSGSLPNLTLTSFLYESLFLWTIWGEFSLARTLLSLMQVGKACPYALEPSWKPSHSS